MEKARRIFSRSILWCSSSPSRVCCAVHHRHALTAPVSGEFHLTVGDFRTVDPNQPLGSAQNRIPQQPLP